MENNVDLVSWLSSVVSLFNGVYGAIMAVPVFRFLLAVLLFLVVVSLAAWLVRLGTRQKL